MIVYFICALICGVWALDRLWSLRHEVEPELVTDTGKLCIIAPLSVVIGLVWPLVAAIVGARRIRKVMR